MRWARILFWLVAIAYAGLLVWQGFTLPDLVPDHMGAGGDPETWTSKSRHLIFAGVVGAAIAWVAGPCSPVMRARSVFNMPHPEYWKREENWPRAKAMLAEDLSLLGALTLAVFGYMHWQTGRVAEGAQLYTGAFGVAIAVFLVLLLAYVVYMYASPRYRPPTEVAGPTASGPRRPKASRSGNPAVRNRGR